MEKLIAVAEWQVTYPHPLRIKKGEAVVLNPEKKEENLEWSGWIWAETNDNASWIPRQSMQVVTKRLGIMTEDYSAQELAVQPGDVVWATRLLNGWVWARKDGQEVEGWIPLNVLLKTGENTH